MINPHSSECVSEEEVVFEIIAQPTISSYNNVLECVSQSSQATTIVGENFVQWTETDVDGNPIEVKPIDAKLCQIMPSKDKTSTARLS